MSSQLHCQPDAAVRPRLQHARTASTMLPTARAAGCHLQWRPAVELGHLMKLGPRDSWPARAPRALRPRHPQGTAAPVAPQTWQPSACGWPRAWPPPCQGCRAAADLQRCHCCCWLHQRWPPPAGLWSPTPRFRWALAARLPAGGSRHRRPRPRPERPGWRSWPATSRAGRRRRRQRQLGCRQRGCLLSQRVDYGTQTTGGGPAAGLMEPRPHGTGRVLPRRVRRPVALGRKGWLAGGWPSRSGAALERPTPAGCPQRPQ